jgi:protein-disulfide isomerase
MQAEQQELQARLAEAEARARRAEERAAEGTRPGPADGQLEELAARVRELERREVRAPDPMVRPGRPDPAKRYRVEIGRAHVRGSDDALVTLVQWASFQCPFSQRVQATLRQLMAAHPGTLRIVYKHNPLPMHQRALPAAVAAEAAGRQGKFWEMHDKLWDNQRDLTDANFLKWAKQIGLNVATFKRDLQDPALTDLVLEHQKQATRLQARGTPAFFINGRFLSGAQPLDAFSNLVAQEQDTAQALVSRGASRAQVYDILMRDASEPG